MAAVGCPAATPCYREQHPTGSITNLPFISLIIPIPCCIPFLGSGWTPFIFRINPSTPPASHFSSSSITEDKHIRAHTISSTKPAAKHSGSITSLSQGCCSLMGEEQQPQVVQVLPSPHHIDANEVLQIKVDA